MQKTYTDKDTRMDAMRADLDNLSAELCIDPEKLDAFGKQWSGGFHCYSLYNTMLIWMQRPDATLIAGKKKWEGLGRRINKGERMIWIWAPIIIKVEEDDGTEGTRMIGFKSVPVVAYEQTNGKELNFDNFGASKYVNGIADHLDIEKINKQFGYDLQITTLNAGSFAMGSTNGKTIKVVAKTNKASMFATYIHEVAHAEMGHCQYNQKKGENRYPRHIKEIQAEAVSYLVCKCFGIENEKSKYYIANWKGTKAEIAQYGHDMIKVANKIVQGIEKALQ